VKRLLDDIHELKSVPEGFGAPTMPVGELSRCTTEQKRREKKWTPT